MQQNPYCVAKWVQGAEHYNRQDLIHSLLSAEDTATWVVGTRRMGKTSLLRQIEWLTDRPGSPFVPLFWDVQGLATAEQFSEDLCWCLDAAVERFAPYQLDIDALRQLDVATILRRVYRAVGAHGRTLLLLIDEAEVLMQIAATDPAWLARLRRTVQEGSMRTIITSTRALAQLMDQDTPIATSPFLFGFHMITLWPLKRDGAIELIHRAQTDTPIAVEPGLVEQILHHTNHHPYLLQALCEQLFVPDGRGGGTLRPIQDDDLVVSHMLAGLIAHDFHSLDEVERALVLHIAHHGPLEQNHLAQRIATVHPARLPVTLRALEELGHTRRMGKQWAIGNEFLRRWLAANFPPDQSTTVTPAQTSPQTSSQTSSQISPQPPPTAAAPPTPTTLADLTHELTRAPDWIHDLPGVQIRHASDFFHLIRRFFIEIRHHIEQDDGYWLLLNPGPGSGFTLKNEEGVQIALKQWLGPMARAANINMERESLTGRGLLDFKFSRGHEFNVLVEVKLFTSAKLLEGLTTQLPTYLLADRSRYGIYVPIFMDSPERAVQVRELQATATLLAQQHGLILDVIDIRAARPRSASKAAALDDPTRYQLPPLPDATVAQDEPELPPPRAATDEPTSP